MALAAALDGPSACRAGLVFEAPNVTTSAGLAGSFGVVLVNTDPTTT